MTKVINGVESKVEYRGVTPVCVHCHKLYSLKKMNETETAKAHETGLCSKCQDEVVTTVTTLNEVKPEVKKEKKVSAASVVKEKFFGFVNDNNVSQSTIDILTNAESTKIETGIKFAFLKEVDSTVPYKEQIVIKNKARYSIHPVEILVDNVYRSFFITNDIYSRNIESFSKFIDTLSQSESK